MPAVKLCLACNKPMIGYRSHAITCGSTCRGIIFRANKTPTVPVKLAFSVHHFESVKQAADNHGMSINDYIMSRSIGSDINIVISC